MGALLTNGGGLTEGLVSPKVYKRLQAKVTLESWCIEVELSKQ